MGLLTMSYPEKKLKKNRNEKAQGAALRGGKQNESQR